MAATVTHKLVPSTTFPLALIPILSQSQVTADNNNNIKNKKSKIMMASNAAKHFKKTLYRSIRSSANPKQTLQSPLSFLLQHQYKDISNVQNNNTIMQPQIQQIQQTQQSQQQSSTISTSQRYYSSVETAQALEKRIAQYYGRNDTNSIYSECWGKGNIHLGYFPHLNDKKAKRLTFEEAATELTIRMCKYGDVNENSKIIDFGCGLGKPAMDIADTFGCHVTGIDLTPEHIDHCKITARDIQEPSMNVEFVRGSFLDLPDEIISQKGTFTHVFAQVSIVHVHQHLSKALKQAYDILKPGGKLVWCDFTACETKLTEQTRKHFYDRLHITTVVSPGEYFQELANGGFNIVNYVRLDDHCSHAYKLLESNARMNGFFSSDGTLLADNYSNTAQVIDDGKVQMCLIIAEKPSE